MWFLYKLFESTFVVPLKMHSSAISFNFGWNSPSAKRDGEEVRDETRIKGASVEGLSSGWGAQINLVVRDGWQRFYLSMRRPLHLSLMPSPPIWTQSTGNRSFQVDFLIVTHTTWWCGQGHSLRCLHDRGKWKSLKVCQCGHRSFSCLKRRKGGRLLAVLYAVCGSPAVWIH